MTGHDQHCYCRRTWSEWLRRNTSSLRCFCFPWPATVTVGGHDLSDCEETHHLVLNLNISFYKPRVSQIPARKSKCKFRYSLYSLLHYWFVFFSWYLFCLFSGALQANSRPGMSFIAFWYAEILHSQLCFLRCIWFGVLKQLLLRRNLIFHWSCSTCLSLNCRMFWDFDFVEFKQPGRHWLHFNFSIGEILRLFSSNESNRYPLHLDCIFI